MNFIKTYTALGSFIGRWRRQVVEVGRWRTMCSKPELPPATPAHAPPVGFKSPEYRPSKMDKKILLWAGRFKTPEQIPEHVSFAMLDAARNKVRIKGCYIAMLLTIGSCLVIIVMGKRDRSQNAEKQALWREEMQREKQTAAAAAGLTKPQ